MDEESGFVCEGCGRHTSIVYNVKNLMFCRTCKEKADGANAEWLAESKKTYELMKEKSL